MDPSHPSHSSYGRPSPFANGPPHPHPHPPPSAAAAPATLPSRTYGPTSSLSSGRSQSVYDPLGRRDHEAPRLNPNYGYPTPSYATEMQPASRSLSPGRFTSLRPDPPGFRAQPSGLGSGMPHEGDGKDVGLLYREGTVLSPPLILPFFFLLFSCPLVFLFQPPRRLIHTFFPRQPPRANGNAKSTGKDVPTLTGTSAGSPKFPPSERSVMTLTKTWWPLPLSSISSSCHLFMKEPTVSPPKIGFCFPTWVPTLTDSWEIGSSFTSRPCAFPARLARDAFRPSPGPRSSFYDRSEWQSHLRNR